jgi:hypothetical protein
MTRVRKYALPPFLALCAVLTFGLLLWPARSLPAAVSGPSPRYRGADFVQNPVARLSNISVSLSGTEAAPSAPMVETPSLLGVAGSSAYLRSQATGETSRVAVGDELDGWKVLSVGARSVTLRGPKGDRRLGLFAAPPAARSTSGP